MNITLEKLKAISKFLKSSGRFYFQNYNIPLFTKFIQEDEVLNGLMEVLSSKYPKTEKAAKELALTGTINYENGNSGMQLTAFRALITSFDEWVSFCWGFVKNVEPNKGNIISAFIVDTGSQEDNEGLSPKLRFFNDCIEPIQIYLELQLKSTLSATTILHRYKVLCEWYDRKLLQNKGEVVITKGHLSRFLFDEGYTYTLSETNVPSGRIDNLASSLGLPKDELYKLPNIIVAEGKIFEGKKAVIKDVQSQVQKRINELNLSEGFCVIFNKSDTQLELQNTSGKVSGVSYLTIDNKRVFFLIINLDDIFYQSTSTVKTLELQI